MVAIKPCSGIVELACLTHARRKFFELCPAGNPLGGHAANQSPIAAEALARIGELYAIERVGQAPDASARQQLWQQAAQPKLNNLHVWLRQTRLTVADGSGLARAIDYSLKRWPALIRYAESGVLPIEREACPWGAIIRSRMRSGPSRSGRRIGYFLDRNVRVNVRRRYKVYWALLS